MSTLSPGYFSDQMSDEQRAVVEAPVGPLLVVAGPGSGKTSVLVHRVVSLIERGIDPGNILLLTFTRAAAQSMLGRARSLSPRARGVMGGTFHAVAALVLRDLHAQVGLPANFVVLDPDDAQAALKAVVEDTPCPIKPGLKAGLIQSVLSLDANTRRGIGWALAQKSPETDTAVVPWLNTIQEQFVHYKIDRGMVDYDDLLTLFAALTQDPELGALIRRRWPHVLLDEHQDSNAIQAAIVYGLGGHTPSVTAVGDPAQSIYGFRGSDPQAMFDFVRHWPNTRVLYLNTNYRSSAPIVDLVQSIDRAMPERFDRVLHSHDSAPAPRPQIMTVADPLHQAEQIAGIIALAHTDGTPWADHAVLVRSSHLARPIEAALTAAKIPYKFVGGLRIDEAAHVKDLLSLARVAQSPGFDLGWVRVLTLLPGLGSKGALVAAKVLLDQEGPASQRLSQLPLSRKIDVAPLHAALVCLEERSPGAALRGAIQDFGPVLATTYTQDWPQRLQDLDSVASIGDACATLADFLTRITLDYTLDKRVQGGGALQEEAPMVVSTVHGAKGLEWPTVFVPGLVAGSLPSGYAKTAEEHAEELRILFVAASRAKRTLIFLKPALRAGVTPGLQEPSIFEPILSPFADILRPVGMVQGAHIQGTTQRTLDPKALLLRRPS